MPAHEWQIFAESSTRYSSIVLFPFPSFPFFVSTKLQSLGARERVQKEMENMHARYNKILKLSDIIMVILTDNVTFPFVSW